MVIKIILLNFLDSILKSIQYEINIIIKGKVNKISLWTRG